MKASNGLETSRESGDVHLLESAQRQLDALRATIDGSSLPVGVAEARVVVAAPEGVSVREVQPAVVSVTITR